MAVSLAGMMEWYDFAVFGYFITEIAAAFFPPEQGARLRLIEAFAIFGGAFVTRPLGGLVLGHRSDATTAAPSAGARRTVAPARSPRTTRAPADARASALETAILLMALPTLGLGCLPTYAQIGLAAPLLLAAIRLLQGVAVGGQLVGCIVYARAARRRFSRPRRLR